MAVINTPGIFIEEQSLFPPSVAETDPSVPVFIGYTEKATREEPDDLLLQPQSVSSLLDYEQYFGRSVQGDFLLYYSMRLYFGNGGGKCFIVSMGKTPGNISKQDFINGLEVTEKMDEPALLLFPEAMQLPGTGLYELQQEALAACARLRDRFCLFDLKPATDAISHAAAVNEFRDNIGMANLQYGAVYTPHLVINADGEEKIIPPSAAVAGIYGTTDSTRGVWKSPANVSLSSVTRLLYTISSEEQQSLNTDTNRGLSVNVIRHFTGKGFLVWGARTLAGNDNEWRYVSVRRFFMMVEESVKKSTRWVVFEPNDAGTWVKVKAMIENYLTLKWRAGALMGAKPQEAFYVKAGLNETMTSLDILEGRLIVEIGMAAIRPAEFIILRFSHKIAVS
ncbi:MAG: phage tail sheath C-terminal domain-containing protein [Chitinophagaceae bacterium]